jgi:hypothetical protein
MLKKTVAFCVLFLAALVCLAQASSAATDEEVKALLMEIKALKKRVSDLEKKLGETCEVTESNQKAVLDAAAKALEARKLAQEARQNAKQAFDHARVATTRSVKASRDVERATEDRPSMVTELGKRLSIHGQLQVEASYERRKPKSGRSSDKSDISLATAEIFFRGDINKYTRGVLHFLWEEGNTEPVDIDEAFLLIGQTSDMPFYVLAGRIYPAVGMFDSYLVSDTITKNLFETQESAAELGYAGGWFNVNLGAYSGALQQSGQGDDTFINSYYTRLQLTNPQGTLNGWRLSGGVAYTNNLGNAGGLMEYIPGERVQDLVGGLSISLAAEYGMFAFVGEYITALDDFKPGELSFADGKKARPSAYNLELAITPWEQWTFAVRYEGAGDLFALEPERQFGGGVNWAFLPDTVLSFEYLRGDYANDDIRDLFTTQLTVAY